VLSFCAVAGILLVVAESGNWALRALKVSIAPFLFTLPVILRTFGTVNFLSPLNSLVATLFFPLFLVLAFLSEITLFKIDFLNRALELTGVYFLKLSQLLFYLTGNFVFHSKISLWLSGTCMLLMLFFVLAGRRHLLFIPPAFLLVYAFFDASIVEGKKLEIEGWKLNSFRFVSTEGQAFKGCRIYSDYVFPATRKFLDGNRLIDKRTIIHSSKLRER